MVDQLEFEQIGSMTSKFFPPLAMMNKGVINDPVRVYSKNNEKYNITAIVADIPIAPMICYEISTSVMDWLAQYKPKRYLPLPYCDQRTGKTGFWVATSTKPWAVSRTRRLSCRLADLGHCIKYPDRVQGAGINGYGLLGETVNAPNRGFRAHRSAQQDV